MAIRSLASIVVVAAIVGVARAQTPPAPSPAPQAGQTMTVDEFRRELVGLPLCATVGVGPLAGKVLCTVHLPDGTAITAGSGVLIRGVWQGEAGKICRRNAHDPVERQRCVEYQKLDADRYRNSDGIDICIGPCP